MNCSETEFDQFLSLFGPRVVAASVAATNATWDASVRATEENARKSAAFEAQYNIIFSDRTAYERLLEFRQSGNIPTPIHKRILDVLILEFKRNLLPEEMIREIAEREAEIRKTFDQFRPELYGRRVTDNDLLEILKYERDLAKRKAAWEASKQVGVRIAPMLRGLVDLRNRAASRLGFKNYFEMAYALEELNPDEVIGTFVDLGRRSAKAYETLLEKISDALSDRFHVGKDEVGPWAWPNPFSQENPLTTDLNPDALLKGVDVVERTAAFYKSIGIDLDDVIRRSDLFEREAKNPHASCWDLDRQGDIRILANVRPSFRWYGTMMHEAGHAAYNVSLGKDLPWFLRKAAHILTTEASAMFFEQTSARAVTIQKLLGIGAEHEDLLRRIEVSSQEQRLVFSRWATVVTLFEKDMYEHPEQDLQELWWDLVEEHQKIRRPQERENFADYAAKIHVVSSPCYYQNYLLADIFVSQLRKMLRDATGTSEMVGNRDAGQILKERLYAPGNLYHWKELVVHTCNKPFGIDDWIEDVGL
jgi:peptidyl-dipeptidase A